MTENFKSVYSSGSLFFLFFFLDEVSSLIFKKNLHKRVLNEKEIMNFDFQNTGP